MNYYDQR